MMKYVLLKLFMMWKLVTQTIWWREFKNISGMADKNNNWFEHLIDYEIVNSVITLKRFLYKS